MDRFTANGPRIVVDTTDFSKMDTAALLGRLRACIAPHLTLQQEEFSMTDSILALARELGFHPSVLERLAALAPRAEEAEARLLTDPAAAGGAAARLAERCRDSGENGLDILAVFLAAAALDRQAWAARGIPDRVFLDTMGCFPRFVEEHFVSFGARGFDRHYWAWRQTAGLLFRLGTLEYELRTLPEGLRTASFDLAPESPVLSIHIPSDADLSRASVLDSFRQAGEFFPRVFPDFCYRAAYCSSWLLSGNLRTLLPAGSRIRGFQDLFEMAGCDESQNSCIVWLFKREYDDPAGYPEDTSLQRSVKAFLLNGGKVGFGTGLAAPAAFPPRK